MKSGLMDPSVRLVKRTKTDNRLNNPYFLLRLRRAAITQK